MSNLPETLGGESGVANNEALLNCNRVFELFIRQRDSMPWQRQANCLGVDPDLFYPERGGSTREAKEVCRQCVVREDCLEYAINNGERNGIWGGLSERERRRIRRHRKLEAPNLSGVLEQAGVETDLA